MASVSDVTREALPELIRRMGQRIDHEPAATSGLLWSATGILMGLRHPPGLIEDLLRGVRNMKESSFYQSILAEGRAQGEAQGKAGEARRILLRLGAKRFGPPDPATIEEVEGIERVERVESMIEGLSDAAGWEELLATTPDLE